MTEMTMKRYLMLDNKVGYPYGVAATSHLGTELHGPFRTRDEAKAYGRALRREYSDYGDIFVVKIEVPFDSDI